MRRILTVGVILAVAGVCFRLGVWQLERLGERKRENATITARTAMAELALTGADVDGLAEYRAVRAEGRFDLDRQIVKVGRPMDGIPGVVVIAPLVLTDGSAILVERGWAPSPDARRVELESLNEPPNVRVSGIVFSPSKDRFPMNEDWPLFVRSVNTDDLAGRYPYPLLPWVMRRTDAPGTDAARVFPPVRTYALSNGPHLGYAFQWFSFGLIALIGGYILVFRQSGPRVNPGNGIDLAS